MRVRPVPFLLGSILVRSGALATPPEGVTATVIGRGTYSDTPLRLHLHGSEFPRMSVTVNEPLDVIQTQNLFDPRGYSGWHSHAGMGWVVIAQGQLDIYDYVECPAVQHLVAGDVFFEDPRHIHNAVNPGPGPTLLTTMFWVRIGDASRVDQPEQHLPAHHRCLGDEWLLPENLGAVINSEFNEANH